MPTRPKSELIHISVTVGKVMQEIFDRGSDERMVGRSGSRQGINNRVSSSSHPVLVGARLRKENLTTEEK